MLNIGKQILIRKKIKNLIMLVFLFKNLYSKFTISFSRLYDSFHFLMRSS